MSNKLKVILMRGLPGSGKSTAAKALVSQHPGLYYRINRDDIRAMLMENHSKTFEKMVARMRDAMFVAGLKDGRNIIIDDTNLDIEKKLAHFQALVAENDLTDVVEFEVVDLTHVSVEDCIARDLARGRSVGEKVIRRMYQDMLAPKVSKLAYDPAKQDAVIFDIDGTLAIMNGRSPYDKTKYLEDLPNTPIVELAKLYDKHTTHKILVVSGRDDDKKDDTRMWLKTYGIGFDELHMRKTGDVRNDALIKKEILENEILPHYNVVAVYDDRNRVVDMWRAHGLLCLQVAPGDF